MACYLVTGGAGFIGSNIVHALVSRQHEVRVLDDFSTGRRQNLERPHPSVEVVEGDICDASTVADAMDGADYCLHQAAIPSVPRSIEDPSASNRANVDGTINVFVAARDAGLRRVVFASSSAVYGNAERLPVAETLPVNPISPYGVNKAADEMYARVFSDLFDMDIVALRYFNVFGPRQNPKSQYAAVIPIFITRMLAGKPPPVDGDGRQSRDFSYVDNIVDANIKAAAAPGRIAGVYNIACGDSCAVIELVDMLNEILGTSIGPRFREARPGDIRKSWADISRARDAFGYEPSVDIKEGLRRTVEWYRNGNDTHG